MHLVLVRGLSKRRLVVKRVAQIVGHLERLADSCAELFPLVALLSRRDGAHLGRRDEQRAGLGAVIGGQVDLRFAFPALPGADAVRHPAAGGQHPDELQGARRVGLTRAGKNIEGQDDQAVTSQKRQRFGIGAVHRRLAAPDVGIVETGHVVVHKAGAVDQFQRGCRGVGKRGHVVAAGLRHRQKDRRPNPRAARCHGIVQRRGQLRRNRRARLRPLSLRDRPCDGGFDPGAETHRRLLFVSGRGSLSR